MGPVLGVAAARGGAGAQRVRAADFRMTRLVHRGELYTPVIDVRTGRMLAPDQVRQLAGIRDEAADAARGFDVLLIDEGPLADVETGLIADARRIEFTAEEGREHGGIRVADPLPIHLGDSGLEIGTVRDVACLPPGALTGG